MSNIIGVIATGAKFKWGVFIGHEREDGTLDYKLLHHYMPEFVCNLPAVFGTRILARAYRDDKIASFCKFMTDYESRKTFRVRKVWIMTDGG